MNSKNVVFAMLLVGFLFGAFYHIWYLIAGEVPSVDHLVMLNKYRKDTSEISNSVVWTLPFSISHSWDTLIAPWFIFAFCYFWSATRQREERETGIVIGVVAGFIMWLISVLIGYHTGLFPELFIGSFFLLFFGFLSGFHPGTFFFIFGYGLMFGALYGIFYTMLPGLVMGLTVSLPALIVFGIIAVFQKFSANYSSSSEILPEVAQVKAD